MDCRHQDTNADADVPQVTSPISPCLPSRNLARNSTKSKVTKISSGNDFNSNFICITAYIVIMGAQREHREQGISSEKEESY